MRPEVVSTAAPTVKPVAVGAAEEVLEEVLVVEVVGVVGAALDEVVMTGALVVVKMVGVGPDEVTAVVVVGFANGLGIEKVGKLNGGKLKGGKVKAAGAAATGPMAMAKAAW
jgi:hypothetical protein